jgi:hypothetical protein
MKHPRGLEVFVNFVSHKQVLLTYLQKTIEQDQALIDQMRVIVARITVQGGDTVHSDTDQSY